MVTTVQLVHLLFPLAEIAIIISIGRVPVMASMEARLPAAPLYQVDSRPPQPHVVIAGQYRTATRLFHSISFAPFIVLLWHHLHKRAVVPQFIERKTPLPPISRRSKEYRSSSSSRTPSVSRSRVLRIGVIGAVRGGRLRRKRNVYEAWSSLLRGRY